MKAEVYKILENAADKISAIGRDATDNEEAIVVICNSNSEDKSFTMAAGSISSLTYALMETAHMDARFKVCLFAATDFIREEDEAKCTSAIVTGHNPVKS